MRGRECVSAGGGAEGAAAAAVGLGSPAAAALLGEAQAQCAGRLLRGACAWASRRRAGLQRPRARLHRRCGRSPAGARSCHIPWQTKGLNINDLIYQICAKICLKKGTFFSKLWRMKCISALWCASNTFTVVAAPSE